MLPASAASSSCSSTSLAGRKSSSGPSGASAGRRRGGPPVGGCGRRSGRPTASRHCCTADRTFRPERLDRTSGCASWRAPAASTAKARGSRRDERARARGNAAGGTSADVRRGGLAEPPRRGGGGRLDGERGVLVRRASARPGAPIRRTSTTLRAVDGSWLVWVPCRDSRMRRAPAAAAARGDWTGGAARAALARSIASTRSKPAAGDRGRARDAHVAADQLGDEPGRQVALDRQAGVDRQPPLVVGPDGGQLLERHPAAPSRRARPGRPASRRTR